jgi:DNA-binding GntR family transcriptional regulator
MSRAIAGSRAESRVGAAEGRRQPQGWSHVYEVLQMDLMLGRLHLRERLVEDDLILRFKATRHAVRRALDELEKEGLVQRQPNRGVRVRDFTLEEVENLYQIREALETLAASCVTLPAEAAFVEDLRKLATAHERASSGRRYAEVFRMNNAFHEKLYSGAGNPELAAAIKYYSLMTQPIRSRGFADEELRQIAIREHGEMVDAIEQSDSGRLVRLCRAHIIRPKEFYLRANSAADATSDRREAPLR